MAEKHSPEHAGKALAELYSELQSLTQRFEALRVVVGESEHSERSLTGSVTIERAAQNIYALRRFRDRVFATPHLFGEPTWDIMLDLFIARARGDRVSVSDACVAASVPASTGLRCIVYLEKDGWITREPDSEDRRRSFLSLTDRAAAHVEEVLGMMAGGGTPDSR